MTICESAESRRVGLAFLLVMTCVTFMRADAPEMGWEKAIKAFQSAIRDRDEKEFRDYARILAATSEAKGVEALIANGLGNDDYVIFSYVAGVLVKLEDPALRKIVCEQATANRNPRTKIVLLAVLRRWESDEAAQKALHAALSDRYKEVVFTALRWIRDLNKPEISVPYLIDELARRERAARSRVYFDIRSALETLTSENFDLAADWKNYWEARLAGNAPRKKEGGRTALFERPSFFSIAIDSDRVLFVIDVSKSMETEDEVSDEPKPPPKTLGSGTTVVRIPRDDDDDSAGGAPRKRSRISAVKNELIRSLRGLPEHVRFNIFSFNHEFALFDPVAGGLIPATRENTKRAIDWVAALTASGATRTDLVLAEALRMPDVDTVIVLTDGSPKKIDNEDIPPEHVYAVVDSLNRFRKARVNTIGFLQAGYSMRKFVEELAARNEGKCVLLE